MGEALDGEFQKYSVEIGRLHPRALLRRRPAPAGDGRAPQRRGPRAPAPRRPRLQQGLRRLPRRDRARGRPTVVLAKTVKGWTLGTGIEARNITHQAKKLTEQELKVFRDRLELAHPRREAQGRPLLPPGPGRAGDPVPARAPGRARRARAAASRPAQDPRAAGRRGLPASSWAVPARRRPRPRWPSPSCCAT